MASTTLLPVIFIFLVVAAHAAPAAKPKPAPKTPAKAPARKGSLLTFNYGTLSVRPGCYLQALGKTKLAYEAHGPCGDKEDQDTWAAAVKVWQATGESWVKSCTKNGKVKMVKGCPPMAATFISKVSFKAGANKWVQHWLHNPAQYTAVKAAFGGSLLDVRKDKLILSQSTLAFVDGFLYVAQSGILGLDKSLVYVEDDPKTGMGAAVMMDDGKIGLIGGQITLNNSLIAMKKSKFYLTKGANHKLVKGSFIMQQSVYSADSSKLEFWDVEHIHIVRSVLNLTNSVLDLVRSNVYMFDSTLILHGAQLNLNMSRLLLSNVKIVGEGYVQSTAEISENFGVTAGSPLDAMNIDFKVESEVGKIQLTTYTPPPKDKAEEIKTTSGKGRRLLEEETI